MAVSPFLVLDAAAAGVLAHTASAVGAGLVDTAAAALELAADTASAVGNVDKVSVVVAGLADKASAEVFAADAVPVPDGRAPKKIALMQPEHGQNLTRS